MSTWVVAVTGAGIDHVNWGSLPAERIAVNHACLVVPEYTYCSACDPYPYRLLGYNPRQAPRIVHKPIYESVHCYDWGGNVVLLDGYNPVGSFDMAVMYALQQGASSIILVGSDEGGTNAESMPWRDCGIQYDKWCSRVLKRIYDICEQYGTTYYHYKEK